MMVLQLLHSYYTVVTQFLHNSILIPQLLAVQTSPCSGLCCTEDRHEGQTKCSAQRSKSSSLEGANPVALPVHVRVCVSLKAMRDPWDSPVASLQTGWHPQSSFFILETAVVSVTTCSANEGVGGEGADWGV